MEIKFKEPAEVVIREEAINEFESITVISVIDKPFKKIVTVNILEGFAIVLWQGAEYDAIGQWTDADVLTRLNELYS